MREGCFEFLNDNRQLDWPPSWRLDVAPKLWQYNLHYFEWLWALDYSDGKQAALHWMEHCSPLDEPVAWEPYPLSLRVLNWCGFFWHQCRNQFNRDGEFQQRLWRSLFLQIEWLTRRLEYHLRGNHLLENGAALVVAGGCFDGPDAARWFETGESLLRKELKEQMLADGMHFERSPMYHSRVTYLLLLLHATGDRRLQDLIQPYLAGALRALQLVCHPDGRIALLNDSAFEVSNEPRQLLNYARAMGVDRSADVPDGSWSLPESGYYGCRNPAGLSIICDAGPVGPDYIPGHAHGDIFSFELSCQSQRICVDSGVFDYVPSEMRRYCRSTRAHNTVMLDGQDQCEFWEAFRVGRRGRPHEVIWDPGPAGFRLKGWHDGYHRLRGRPRHTRLFSWHTDGILLVRDEIDSGRNTEAVARIHLHPDCKVIHAGLNAVGLNTPAGTFAIHFAGSGMLQVEESCYCPEFGRRIPNQALAWTARGPHIRFGFCFAPVPRIAAFDLESGASLGRQRYDW